MWYNTNMEEEKKSNLAKQMEMEISDYFSKKVSAGGDENYSQPKLVRRISLFEGKIYPNGKFDKQGNYKFWYDIQTSRVDSEVKNIDFDTKNIEAYSPLQIDEVPSLISNLKLAEYLRDTGQAEELNSAIEEGSAWGNVVWKKVKKSYERVDLKNFYVINQVAQTLDGSTAIERHQLTSVELREKVGEWKNADKVLKSCGQNIYKSDVESTEQDTTTPIFSIYERNGEVKLSDLKEHLGEKPEETDKDKYVFAKVIGAGTEGTNGGVKIKYIVHALNLSGLKNSDIYKEYHRGKYKGRWWREGIIELLFDCQVRANEIGNQIAQGLQYAAKVLFTGEDKQIIQNIITDIKNGDYIRSKDLRQVEVRMQGFDQLMADWNRNIDQANEIANSREIVQGITPASGTPLGTSQMLNANANKLYDFLREKISIPIRKIYEDIIPEFLESLKAEEVLRLSGDSKMMDRMRNLIAENWYIENLAALGPHTRELAKILKQQKLEELSEKKELFITEFEKIFKNFKPRISVVITGENTRRMEERDAFVQFIPLEADPIRRSAMVEEGMRRSGIDVGGLPKSNPEALAGQLAGNQQNNERSNTSGQPANQGRTS